MEESQAKALIRDAFKQLELSELSAKKADAELYRALIRITSRIRGLPPHGDIMREKVWRKIRRDLPELLNPYVQKLGLETLTTLKAEIVNIEKFARSYIEIPLEIAGEKGKVTVGGFSSGITPDPNIRAIESPLNFTAQVHGQQTTVRAGASSLKVLNKIQVAGANVQKLLGVGVNEAGKVILLDKRVPELGGFLFKSVEREVTLGILRGDTTEAIARQLVSSVGVDRGVLGAAAKKVRSQAMGVTRTVVADATQRIHEQVWDQLDKEGNDKTRIVSWRYEGSMDGRICERCLPWDGAVKKNRSDLPAVPQHPRCRCVRLPETRTSISLKGDPNAGTAIEYFNEQQLSEKFGRKRGEDFNGFLKRVSGPRERGQGVGDNRSWRVYKTPQKGPDGERWYRASHDLSLKNGRPLNAAGWLGQAEPATQQQFFGGGSSKVGAIRAEIFRKKIKSGKTAQQALNELLTGDKMEGQRFIPLSKLNVGLLEAERILSPREEALLARRKAQSRKRSSAKAKP